MNTPILCRRQVALHPFVGKAAGRKLAVLALMVFASLTGLHGQSNYATPYTFTTLAGQAAIGDIDGIGSAARFRSPLGVAVNGAGNVFVADFRNHTIRKITSAGVVTTFAGSAGNPGSADGTGGAARFNSPEAIAVDNAGNLYVADSYNHTIRKITSAGVVTTLAGSAGESGATDGTGSAARFYTPYGIATDAAGNVYVSDSGNYTIRKITPAGVVTTLAGTAGESGAMDGTGSAARFYVPIGVAVDSAGNVYVADTQNSTIRKITSIGVVTTFVGTAGSTGSADGIGSAARFYYPTGLAVDIGGNVYVADAFANTIRKITAVGAVTTLAGSSGSSGSVDATGGAARFSNPQGVAVDAAGNVYVADNANHTLRKITPASIVTTLAGIASTAGNADGAGGTAQFYFPLSVAVDTSGNVYVADTGNHTIRKTTNAGVVTTLAGTASNYGSSDGTGSAAQFWGPHGVAVDGAGNVYVADKDNNTIRKITPAGVVTTLAGSAGNAGSNDGTGGAARFSNPHGVAVDAAGNVYVADTFNHTIRKITAAGVVTTIAGTAGSPGSVDDTGGAARFYNPYRVAVDGVGNIYVADSYNYTIRKITAGGVVTTIAGIAGSQGTADGMGTAARFLFPHDVAVDGAGSVYVADAMSNHIRKISPDGMVTTLAGNGTGSADGTGDNTEFNSPRGVAVDVAGNLYVADTVNNIIRWGALSAPALTSATTASGTYGQSFTYAVTFSGTLRNYSASGLPVGLSFNAATGVISGIPTAAGSYSVTLGATNGAGTGTATLTLTIAKATATVSLGSLSTTYDGSEKSVFARQGVVTTIAGTVGISGSADGTGSAARFNLPRCVAVDGAGNIYITDQQNYTIRKITTTGAVTTFAGTAGIAGAVDGTGSAARFAGPQGVAVDDSGNVYVADQFNHTIRKITAAGVVTTLAGTAGIAGAVDGTGSAARFDNPFGVAVVGSGNVYVADTMNGTIRKITSGGVVTTLAGTAGVEGSADGIGGTASFNQPFGVAVDGAGNVYVADTRNHTIRKITPAGVVTTLAGTAGYGWAADGTGSAARFAYPYGVAVDGAGTVFVADTANESIRKITPGGVVTTLAGTAGNAGSTDGTTSVASLNHPFGVAVDRLGNVYFADTINSTVRKLTGVSGDLGLTYNGSSTIPTAAGSYIVVATLDDPNYQGTATGTLVIAKATATVSLAGLSATYDGTSHVVLASQQGVVTTLAGTAGSPGAVEGASSTAQFYDPASVAVDGTGNVYVADTGNQTIRKITSAGVVTTLAGTTGSSGSTDGAGSAAQFFAPKGVAVDGAGNVYVADFLNDTIRKITAAGSVTTLAGTAGQGGSTNGPGSFARFTLPVGVAVDGAGNVYVADTYNSLIRKITPVGLVTTLTQGGSGSTVNLPRGVSVDGSGNVYFADTNSHTIKKITAAGVVTTVAGTSGSIGSADGIGSAARFNTPSSVAVDAAGNLYVADTGNQTIRKITPTGVVTTLAGTAGSTGTIDGIGSTAQFHDPSGVAVDAAGSLYVADYSNHTIRKITGGSGSVTLTYNGSSTAPTAAGSYTVIATLNDPNYQGSASGTLVISKATVSVTLGNLNAIYDAATHDVTASQQGVVTTFAGSIINFGSADGTGASARFYQPSGMALDGSDNLYVADTNNHTIRKITSGRVVTTLAGFAGISGSFDGTGTAARFFSPTGVAVDGSGNIYVADHYNRTIRKIASGGVVTTFAGTAGSPGADDGTGSAARFFEPVGVAVDGLGNLFVADVSIRKITPTTIVTTFAGSYVGGSTDGTGSAAQFFGPQGVAMDVSGNLYVADTNNHTVRKVTPAGMVTTLAGTAGSSGSNDGMGSVARFNSPSGVAVDGLGNVYVADTGNFTIRKITPAGAVTTLAGTAGSLGYNDGTGSAAQFFIPRGMAISASGNLFVADGFTIRKITGVSGALTLTYDGSATAPTSPGSYTVVATLNDPNYQGTATGTLVIAMASQTITFGSVAAKNYGEAPFTVSATASSGLAPTYSIVSGPATISGNTVTLTGGGLVTVRATQAGNSNYHAAPSVDQSFTVSQAPAMTTQPASKTVPVGSPVILMAAASGFPVPTYQWQKNGVNIPGATGSTYPISRVSHADAASYRVIAANPVATVASNTVTLSVVAVPGDFNGDNQPDILWQNTTTGALRLWLMNGPAKASESTLSNVGAGWQVAGTADFNGDNQTDILWQNTVTGERGYWPMTGTSQGGYQPIATVDPVWNIGGAADFNGDGRPDIIWENTLTGERGIWLLNGVSLIGWAPLGTLAVQWNVAGTGDFNADGSIDLVWQNTLTGERKVWLMNDTAKSSEISLGFVALAWSIGAVADYNGDGKPDIYFQNTLTGERAIWLMNGTTLTGYAFPPTESTDWVIGRIPSRPAATDFNRDGKPDVVWQNTSTGERKVWLMNGTAFSSEVSFGAVGLPWQIAGTGDLDGDGRCDILWQNTTTGERGVWLMLGTSLSGFVPLGTIATSWQMVGTADFNNDNRTDIVWQNTTTGERGIWLMAGTTLSGWVSLGNVAPAWQIAGVADFNRDDNPDLLWQNTSTGERKVWYMTGTTFTSEASFGTVALSWQMVGTGDYNLDGSTDIVWQNTSTGERGIWLLNGTALSGYADLGTQPLAWQIAN